MIEARGCELAILRQRKSEEPPINRPLVPLHNNQRDGFMRQTVNRGQTSYEPNSLKGGCPFQAGADMGGFTSYAERIDARKIRERSPSFMDHFSQATLFFNRALLFLLLRRRR